MPDEHDELDELTFVEHAFERVPLLVVDVVAIEQLVDGRENGRLAR